MRPVGVTVKKKIIPIVKGLTTRWRSRPNFIHRRLNRASTEGTNNAMTISSPAMLADQTRTDPVPKTQGQTATNAKTKTKTNPNERLDEPLTTS